MKTFLSVLFLIASTQLMFSQNLAKAQKQLVGKWLYVSGSGGFTGKGPGYTKDQKVMYEFQKKGKMQRCEKGKPSQKDTYQILKAKNVNEEGTNFLITYKNQMEQDAFIKGDTLYLQELVADGFSYVFVRKR